MDDRTLKVAFILGGAGVLSVLSYIIGRLHEWSLKQPQITSCRTQLEEEERLRHFCQQTLEEELAWHNEFLAVLQQIQSRQDAEHHDRPSMGFCLPEGG